MKGPYYKETYEKNNVSVDVFNLDTNYADSHGYHQVCCQCYGYQSLPGVTDADRVANNCNDQHRGGKYCAGGDTEMYDACAATIKQWWDQSVEGATKDMKASKADFKIVNTHYSPHFHMSVAKMKMWYQILSENNVQVWLNGHTHGFNHDISKFGTHFFENGGGGGIQSETSGLPPDTAKEFVTK